MKINSLRRLYAHLLRDACSTEEQIIKALPKMIEAAHHEELQQAFQSHLEETEGQLQRLEQALETLGFERGEHECQAMKGILSEGEELMREKDIPPVVLDAGLIASAQKVEHYEISLYGTLAHYSNLLDYSSIAKDLKQTLDQERDADKKLNRLAKKLINRRALEDTP